MRTCPYCNQEAFSFWRKSFLGPARTAECRSCGRKVSVSWVSLLGMVPLLAGMFAFARLEGSPLGIAALVGGIVAVCAFHEYVSPLVGRDG